MITIDVRDLPAKSRHSRIFEAFDGLAPGGSIRIVTDHDPRPLLASFQQERPGLYDWAHIEEGPERWQASITRRFPSRAGRSTISDMLGFDHDRLDVLLAETRDAWARGDLALATTQFDAFETGLRRHIHVEDEVLFPAFEAITGTPPELGPTAVMRYEHREIDLALAGVRAAILAENTREPAAMGDLVRILEAHNRKEEHVLYPMTDGHLDEAQREHLCRTIETM